jgi:hypothetical protein
MSRIPLASALALVTGLALSLSLSTPSEAFDYSSWARHEAVSGTGNGASPFSVMRPGSFEPVPAGPQAPVEEYVLRDPSGERSSYLSGKGIEDVLENAEAGADGIIRNKDGSLNNALVAAFWVGFFRSVEGVTERRAFLAANSRPAATASITRTRGPDDMQEHMDMDTMFILDGTAMIMLECGDIAATPETGHDRTSREICRPFFESLSFGGAADAAPVPGASGSESDGASK